MHMVTDNHSATDSSHKVLGVVQQDKLSRQVQLQRMSKQLEREFGARQEHAELMQQATVADEELIADDQLETLAPALMQEIQSMKRRSGGGFSPAKDVGDVLRHAELKKRRTTVGDVAGVSGSLANPTMRYSKTPTDLGHVE